MTQIPESSDGAQGVQTAGQNGGGGPTQQFTPLIVKSGPKPPPHRLYIFLGVCVVVSVVGFIFCAGKPEKAEAKTKPTMLDFRNMTSRELAENASAAAARELARRMFHGTEAERASASSAVNCWSSPRLGRNMAIAMALEQQKKAQELARRMEEERRMMMEGMY